MPLQTRFAAPFSSSSSGHITNINIHDFDSHSVGLQSLIIELVVTANYSIAPAHTSSSHNANSIQVDPLFPQLSRLPLEVRNMIWEATIVPRIVNLRAELLHECKNISRHVRSDLEIPERCEKGHLGRPSPRSMDTGRLLAGGRRPTSRLLFSLAANLLQSSPRHIHELSLVWALSHKPISTSILTRYILIAVPT